VRDNPKEKNLGECSPNLTIPGVVFLVQIVLWEAYDKVVWKWVKCLVGVQLQTRHPGLVAYRQFIRKNIWIPTNYWNFFKMGDNGHIGTRVCIVLKS
jgi:hypothetical protein